MTSTVKRMAVVSLASIVVLTWQAQTGEDAVGAQAPKTVKVTRIYTGPDGESHAEETDMVMKGTVSEMIKATGVQFSRRPPSTSDGQWHNGPRRQYVITLSGKAEIEVSDGTKVAIGPGHINLIEDTTGKGHITRNLGPDDRIVVTIPLADQTGSAR